MRRIHAFQLFLTVAAATASAQTAPERLLHSPLPEQWTYTPAAEQTLPSDDAWWRDFGDPTLDSLISMAEERNFDLSMASRRITQARQAVKAARAAYYPTIGASAGWQRSHAASATTGGYSLDLQASWEIDLFGKVTGNVRQQSAALQATRAQYTAAMISLCSEVAITYFDLRLAQAQKVVADEHIARQQRIVNIARARHEAGLASQLDVAQALTVLYSTQATLPLLHTQLRTDINALATLCGVYAADIEPMLEARTAQQPDCRRIIAAGIPAELLRRRPDIIEAEASVARAAAALGVAKKDYLPTLAITGSIGTASARPRDLFSDGSLTWSVAPTLSWTVFDGLARSASVASARAEMESQIDNYNATVHNAVQEVDNALNAYSDYMRQYAILEDVVTQSRISLDLSVDQYKQGLSPFTNVVDAQMNYLEYTNSLLSAKGDALVALASLYRALGGGTQN